MGPDVDKKLTVARGNCPCTRQDPRELTDLQTCTRDELDCGVEDLLGQLPESVDVLGARDLAQPSVATLRLSGLAGLYGHDFGQEFILCTSPAVQAALEVVNDTELRLRRLEWRSPDDRATLIEMMAEVRAAGHRGCVLWIAETEFEHYLPEHLTGIKLGAIPFFSAEFTVPALISYLDIVSRTDYAAEERLEGDLITRLEGAERLELATPDLDARCTFDHLRNEHWFSLHGALRWGDQTVLPTGELSTLTDASGEFSDRAPFKLTGRIVFQGSPIVHRGDESVSMAETDAAYRRLAVMGRNPVVAEIDGGYIERFTAPVPESKLVRDVFTALVDAEPRYRKVHEFGFGTHPLCRRHVPGNFHPNERWPGIHIGLGLGGHTPFHIDLALTRVDVFTVRAGERRNLYEDLGLR